MPRGDKSSYSSKQKRQAEHIEEVTKSVERLKKKRSVALGRLLISRTRAGKTAAVDAEKNPAMQVRAKVGAKAAKRRKNRTEKTSIFNDCCLRCRIPVALVINEGVGSGTPQLRRQ